MSIDLVSRVGVLGLVLAAFAQLASAQSAPKIDIPDAATNQAMLPAYVKQISEYAKFYAKALLDAKTETGVMDARKKLLDALNQYSGIEYKRAFAHEAGLELLPVFSAKGPLGKLQQTNAGLVIAAMPYPGIAPALDKMVVHADAVVRYFGWRTYKAIRPQLIVQNKAALDALYGLLGAGLAKETSALVIGEMLDFMNFSSVDLSGAGDDFKKVLETEPYSLLMKNWPSLCAEVQGGDEAMADTCRNGANTLVYFAGLYGADKARQKAVLQALTDVLWCAASSYDKALAQAASDKASPAAKADANAIIDADVQLLVTAENSLKTASGKKDDFVQKALTDTKEKERGATVKLAVLKWLDALKGDGVVESGFFKEETPATSATSPGK